MAVKTGRNAALGVAAETTYGEKVTPDRFYEFRTEGLSREIARIESQGIRKGQRTRKSHQWAPGVETVSGDITAEVAYQGFGLWLKHALGAASSDGTGPDYEHTFTPGDLEDKSLTAQIDLDNIPKAYTGVVVASWQLGVSTGEYATLQLSLVGREELLEEPELTPSYPDPLILLPFTHATLKVAGDEVKVTEAQVEGDNQLVTDRSALGSGKIRRPAEADLRQYSVNFNADFESLALYNRYVGGEEAQLELTFEGPEIPDAGGAKHELKVTANVRYDGTTPQVGGREEIRQEMTGTVIDPVGSDPDLSVLYRTTDENP